MPALYFMNMPGHTPVPPAEQELPKSEDLHESQGKIQGGPGGNALDLR